MFAAHGGTMATSNRSTTDYVRHRPLALGYRTPGEYAAACGCTHTPIPRWPAATENGTNQTDSRTGWTP